jgi:SAM-dependent methyltransferase
MLPPINPVAQSGFRDADAYEAHRPSYPPEAVSRLLQGLNVEGLSNGHIVDLAAGTGKFTELLAAREEDYEIVAVEPHADMLDVLRRKGLRGVKTVMGSGEEMAEVQGGWADAVVVAQVSLYGRGEGLGQGAEEMLIADISRRHSTGKPRRVQLIMGWAR